MFISDLSYLETTQATDLVGGGRKGKKRGRRGPKVDIDITIIKQNAKALAVAVGKGHVSADASAYNYAYVD